MITIQPGQSLQWLLARSASCQDKYRLVHCCGCDRSGWVSEGTATKAKPCDCGQCQLRSLHWWVRTPVTACVTKDDRNCGLAPHPRIRRCLVAQLGTEICAINMGFVNPARKYRHPPKRAARASGQGMHWSFAAPSWLSFARSLRPLNRPRPFS